MAGEIEFKSRSEWALTTAEDAAIATLIKQTYAVDFQGRSFCHQRHHVRFLAYCDQQLVGHIALLFRSIRMANSRVDIAGIAEVATAKNYRRRGIAARLLNDALDLAQQSCADFVLLFGTQNIYKKAGFRPQTNTVHACSLDGNKSGNPVRLTGQPLMVRELGSKPWTVDEEIDLLGAIF